jgi:hypothetical protein
MSALADSASQDIAMDAILKADQSLGAVEHFTTLWGNFVMGRGILLWMLGVPLPIILLLAMCSHN